MCVCLRVCSLQSRRLHTVRLFYAENRILSSNVEQVHVPCVVTKSRAQLDILLLQPAEGNLQFSGSESCCATSQLKHRGRSHVELP